MRRQVSLLMFLTAAVLFLAACAGESDESTTDTAPPAAAAQTEADDSTKASTDKSTSETATAKEEEAAPKVEEVPKLSLPITEDTLTAPRIMGEGVNEWINSEELILANLQAENKVVLIDFWTYTCINCIRTLPYLKQWHDKYADSGLVIIGVHTPEFEFEKSLENVQEAVGRFEIEYPVVQDNNYWTWNAFTNRYWPAKYLIDKDGYIRYSHFGEGRYDETEQAIRLLLEEADQAVSDISDAENPIRLVAPNAVSSRSPDGLTRELYAGTDRNYSVLRSGIRAPYVLNEEFYKQANSDTEYIDPRRLSEPPHLSPGPLAQRRGKPQARADDGGVRGLHGPPLQRRGRERRPPHSERNALQGTDPHGRSAADKRGRRHRYLVRRRGQELHHR